MGLLCGYNWLSKWRVNLILEASRIILRFRSSNTATVPHMPRIPQNDSGSCLGHFGLFSSGPLNLTMQAFLLFRALRLSLALGIWLDLAYRGMPPRRLQYGLSCHVRP